MHAMPSGGVLDLHLDCDVHPRTGFRRALNLVLFVGEWSAEWGGGLEFWEGKKQASVLPRRNRLVAFQTNDFSYHGVPRPIPCPPGVLRKSLAVYFWEAVPHECQRPRAKFVSLPGEETSPEKLSWQEARCRS